jgi:hypothetical protein
MFTLDKSYYYISQKELKVKKGIMTQYNIDKSGYGLCYIYVGKDPKTLEANYDRVEETLIFENKKEAQVRLSVVKPIIEKANKKSEELHDIMTAARILVIGKPKYKSKD